MRDILLPYSKILPKVGAPSTDMLDDRETWLNLIIDFTELPMNYGADVGGIGPLARAAGIDPHRAVAKVETYYHHNASRGLQ
jgi:hypothetical protein